MPSTHKISFSIIDILDPKKFNSKRVHELSVAPEKFPALNAEGANVDCDSTAGGDVRVERAEAGRENTHYYLLFTLEFNLFCSINCFAFADFTFSHSTLILTSQQEEIIALLKYVFIVK